MNNAVNSVHQQELVNSSTERAGDHLSDGYADSDPLPITFKNGKMKRFPRLSRVQQVLNFISLGSWHQITSQQLTDNLSRFFLVILHLRCLICGIVCHALDPLTRPIRIHNKYLLRIFETIALWITLLVSLIKKSETVTTPKTSFGFSIQKPKLAAFPP
ncbi:hypothetical protein [Halorubrum salinum]|uniref:hypothetical protein n=1 Tax=Halorubrum salinum TaxID=767517 RepID=UPI00211117B8|nr:hypothetical protein [Halorubrum salinum]